jgi:hypothetical protein
MDHVLPAAACRRAPLPAEKRMQGVVPVLVRLDEFPGHLLRCLVDLQSDADRPRAMAASMTRRAAASRLSPVFFRTAGVRPPKIRKLRYMKA